MLKTPKKDDIFKRGRCPSANDEKNASTDLKNAKIVEILVYSEQIQKNKTLVDLDK